MSKQQEINFDLGRWGGKRKNAGRKRMKSKGVAHNKRETVSIKTPVHINMKMADRIRNEDGLLALKRAIQNSAKFISIIHYSLQSNHIHLIVEAKDNDTLSRGMMSFSISFAKAFGKGSLLNERYHLHVLRGLRETKNAFKYVIFNELHHSRRGSIRADLFSSIHQLNLKQLSKDHKISIIKENFKADIPLDQPTSWLAKQGLKPT